MGKIAKGKVQKQEWVREVLNAKSLNFILCTVRRQKKTVKNIPELQLRNNIDCSLGRGQSQGKRRQGERRQSVRKKASVVVRGCVCFSLFHFWLPIISTSLLALDNSSYYEPQ